jgi:hypothetical protein
MINLIGLAFVFFAQNSFAGGEGTTVGDGGQGILCDRYSAHSNSFVETVELLDFYEARRLYRSAWREPTLDKTIFVNWSYSRSACRILGERKKSVNFISIDTAFLNKFDEACSLELTTSFKELPFTEDTGPLLTPLERQCEVVQLAVHSRSGKVYLNRSYAELLDDQHVAALLLHEVLHGYFTEKESNLVVRQVIAYVFADRKFQSRNRRAFLELLQSRKAVEPSRFN